MLKHWLDVYSCKYLVNNWILLQQTSQYIFIVELNYFIDICKHNVHSTFHINNVYVRLWQTSMAENEIRVLPTHQKYLISHE